MIKKKTGGIVYDVLIYVFLAVLAVICVYPMIYVLFASVSDYAKLMSNESLLLKPLGFNLSAYIQVSKNSMILSGYKNTLFVLIVGTSVNMILTVLGAYVLSRRDLYFKRFIMGMFLFTMYFSGGLIPTYLTVKSIGLDNSLWALILPGAVSTFNLIIMKTGFESIPSSLMEVAQIDGAGEVVLLLKIILPLSKPVLAVICLYYAVANWNAWFNAAIYLNDRDKFPLQLVLREILIANDTRSMTTDAAVGDTEQIAKTIQYATVIVSTVPILIVYPFLQKYFEKGALIGAIKG